MKNFLERSFVGKQKKEKTSSHNKERYFNIRDMYPFWKKLLLADHNDYDPRNFSIEEKGEMMDAEIAQIMQEEINRGGGLNNKTRKEISIGYDGVRRDRNGFNGRMKYTRKK